MLPHICPCLYQTGQNRRPPLFSIWIMMQQLVQPRTAPKTQQIVPTNFEKIWKTAAAKH